MTASSLYNMVDSIFIGHGVGPLAISGLAITFPLMNLAAAFGSLVGVGASTLVSVKLGQKDYATAQNILGNVVTLNFIIGIGFSILTLLFLDPILYFFGASPDTISYARDYMVIILLGNVITHMYLGLNALLRASGHPQKAMTATITTVIINTILDPIFIYLFHWGIQGAAIATILAQIISLVWQFKTFTNKTALQAFWNTFEYTIILVPVVLILATLLALLVNRKAKGVTFFRMIYFSPQVVTMTVVTVIWGFFFSSTADGLFNSILRVFGVPAQKWLQDTTLAMPSIAIMSIWQCVGMQMIIMLGGLQFIPEELYEAGTIDGANTWQQFIYITIPQLKNTLVYVFISNTIYSLKMFTQVYMLTQGGPAGSTTTLVYLMYQEGFTNNRVGYTSAMAVVFFLIVLVVSLIQNKLTEGD